MARECRKTWQRTLPPGGATPDAAWALCSALLIEKADVNRGKGGSTLTNRCRERPVRPWRIQSTMASPTSTGSGMATCRPHLPRTRISPASQSKSSSRMAMTSWPRRPSRAIVSSIAWSRRAMALSPLAAARTRSTSSRDRCRVGAGDRGSGTLGTQGTRFRSVRPVANRNRNSDRRAVAVALAPAGPVSPTVPKCATMSAREMAFRSPGVESPNRKARKLRALP